MGLGRTSWSSEKTYFADVVKKNNAGDEKLSGDIGRTARSGLHHNQLAEDFGNLVMKQLPSSKFKRLLRSSWRLMREEGFVGC